MIFKGGILGGAHHFQGDPYFCLIYCIYVIVKALPRIYGKYSMKRRVKKLIQHEAKPSAIFSSRHPPSALLHVHKSIGGALSVILYFLVVWLGVIFSSTQTVVIFGYQDISKCLTNLFLVVE